MSSGAASNRIFTVPGTPKRTKSFDLATFTKRSGLSDIVGPDDHAEVGLVVPHRAAVDVVEVGVLDRRRLAALLGRVRHDDDRDLEPPGQPLELAQRAVEVGRLGVLPAPQVLDLVPWIDQHPLAAVARRGLLDGRLQPIEVEVAASSFSPRCGEIVRNIRSTQATGSSTMPLRSCPVHALA